MDPWEVSEYLYTLSEYISQDSLPSRKFVSSQLSDLSTLIISPRYHSAGLLDSLKDLLKQRKEKKAQEKKVNDLKAQRGSIDYLISQIKKGERVSELAKDTKYFSILQKIFNELEPNDRYSKQFNIAIRKSRDYRKLADQETPSEDDLFDSPDKDDRLATLAERFISYLFDLDLKWKDNPDLRNTEIEPIIEKINPVKYEISKELKAEEDKLKSSTSTDPRLKETAKRPRPGEEPAKPSDPTEETPKDSPEEGPTKTPGPSEESSAPASSPKYDYDARLKGEFEKLRPFKTAKEAFEYMIDYLTSKHDEKTGRKLSEGSFKLSDKLFPLMTDLMRAGKLPENIRRDLVSLIRRHLSMSRDVSNVLNRESIERIHEMIKRSKDDIDAIKLFNAKELSEWMLNLEFNGIKAVDFDGTGNYILNHLAALYEAGYMNRSVYKSTQKIIEEYYKKNKPKIKDKDGNPMSVEEVVDSLRKTPLSSAYVLGESSLKDYPFKRKEFFDPLPESLTKDETKDGRRPQENDAENLWKFIDEQAAASDPEYPLYFVRLCSATIHYLNEYNKLCGSFDEGKSDIIGYILAQFDIDIEEAAKNYGIKPQRASFRLNNPVKKASRNFRINPQKMSFI